MFSLFYIFDSNECFFFSTLHIHNICFSSEPGESASILYNELKSAYPEHLSVHTAMLTSLDSTESRRCVPHNDISENSANLANQMITVADAVISSINQDKLLAHFGLKNDQRPDAAKIKVSMEKQRNSLIEALVKKGCALGRLYVHCTHKGDDEASLKNLTEGINTVWKDVQKYVEPTDLKVIYWLFNIFILSFIIENYCLYNIIVAGDYCIAVARTRQQTVRQIHETFA